MQRAGPVAWGGLTGSRAQPPSREPQLLRVSAKLGVKGGLRLWGFWASVSSLEKWGHSFII